MRKLSVLFDYASPFAYLATEVLPAFAARNDLTLDWTPIELGSLSHYANGLPYSPIKRRYVVTDAIRSAEYHGVPIALPQPHPVPSRPALLLATAARSRPGFQALHRALFRAAWLEQQDLSDRDVLARCAAQADLAASELLDELASPEAGEALLHQTREAEELGVFGVPTFVLDGELFWGLDSLPVLEWRLEGSAAD